MCFIPMLGKKIIFMKNLNFSFQNELGSRSSSTHIGTNNFKPLVFPKKKKVLILISLPEILGFVTNFQLHATTNSYSCLKQVTHNIQLHVTLNM